MLLKFFKLYDTKALNIDLNFKMFCNTGIRPILEDDRASQPNGMAFSN